MLILAAVLANMSPASAADNDNADADLKAAADLFRAGFAGRCADHAFTDDHLASTDFYAFDYRSSFASADAPSRHAVLYQFFCDNFAHAGSAAFILKDNDGHFSVMAFATPYHSPEEEAGPIGFASSDSLLDPEFDPQTLRLTSSSHDATQDYYSVWAFRDDAFVFIESERYRFAKGRLVEKPPETEE
jgi:hypothetical protein